MNWIKKIFENKLYTFLLVGYMISQFFFPLNELIFIAAIVVAIRWISKTYKSEKNFTALTYSIILNLVANLILTAIYIPTLILNPNINWSLQDGRNESDPMILLAYFPAANFILFLIIVLFVSVSLKIFADSE